ncbi:NYN domain-containing protein [bacterium]|jgi:uncharacterized LabA/DUF88 family protein|nr:NYN domain-containing protein [bacterium]
MKIAVFVDGANFFYMQKDRLHWWIDPKRLLDWVRTLGELVDAFYYVAVDDPIEPQQENFLRALTYMGFSVVTKPLRIVNGENGHDRKKANLDVEIVLDMMTHVSHYDAAVLVSGDADFERPLQTIRARGRKFLIMSTQGFVAREIRQMAGMHFVDFQDIRDHVEKR